MNWELIFRNSICGYADKYVCMTFWRRKTK